MTRVLVIEDEPALADAIKYAFEREGFACSVANDGRAGVERFRMEKPDLVLLDLMLPGLSGLEVFRSIRSDGATPIIMVSAKDSETDKVVALELGADDYVTKPVGMRELIARVRTVLRRMEGAGPAPDRHVVRAAHVELDTERHEARIHGRLVPLPPKEFVLLEILTRRAGRLCTRDALIADVWGSDYVGDTRTLDVHVRRLRRKIEADPRRPEHLVTVRGLGYKFQP